MKKAYLLLFFTVCSLYVLAQTTIVDSIYIGGQFRSYRLYVPAIYTGATTRPLILNLHGYTSNAQQQQLYSNFMPVADTANFLMVYPNGTYSSGQRFWNAGISPTLVNDIEFLSALIDSIDLTYNINLNRVYSTGMSNGGFMSHTLACELSNRITAVASVTGGIFSTQYGSNCHPVRPVPAMQIHGTADPTVPYAGNPSQGMVPIDSVVKYWRVKNGCNPTATFSNVPNTNTSDGCTVEHYQYKNGALGSSVELYKVINGGHTWPGFPFGGVGTNMDINASKEIWRFFNKYSLMTLTDVSESQIVEGLIKIYPNPAKSELYIEADGKNHFEITDLIGKRVLTGYTKSSAISLDNLESGMYVIVVKTENGDVLKQKLIKE